MATGLNICVISPSIPPDFGGGGKLVYDQVTFMASQGERCTIVTKTRGAKGSQNLDIVRMPQLAVGEKQRGRIVDYVSLYPRFLRVLKRIKPDVVHVMSADAWTLLGVAAAKTLDIPVALETSLVGADDPLTIRNSRFGSIKFEILSDIDALISVSPSLDECAEEAGIPEEKRHIIGNLVDVDLFQPADAAKKVKLKKKLGLEKFDRLLVYVGAIIERKRVLEVIKAYDELPDDVRKGTGLLLVGPVPDTDVDRAYRKMLDEFVAAHDLGDDVVFAGSQDNVQDWMAASDLFVFASAQEGFGTVVIEAMAAGLPVVVRRIPKISTFIISPDEDGYITDSHDEFRAEIEELMRDDDKRARFGVTARRNAVERFSVAKIAQSYLNLFEQLQN